MVPPSDVTTRLALLVSSDDWSARALQSALQPGGYRALQTWNVRETREVMRVARPDVVLLLANLPDGDAVDLCRWMRHDARVSASTPVVIIRPAPVSPEQRLDGLRAGAWDVLALPLNPEELRAKLDTYVAAKLDADRAREDGLVDQGSGLYGARGIERRAREMLADALRRQMALACVLISAETGPGDQAPTPSAAAAPVVQQHVAGLLRAHGRLSDVIGRWHHDEFAVLAPGTDAGGAEKLAARLARVIETSPPATPVVLPPLVVKAGYEALDNGAVSSPRAIDLLGRAEAALQLARGAPKVPHILRYAPAASRHS
ncbi:MAG TPA: response regulator [Gemmatimonadales bacterium]|nr:response regulator [Gemmatimonadales bacterium]